jgi:hypothetical protein
MIRRTPRIARKPHRCEHRGYEPRPDCRIEPGDRYLEAVMSPNHDGLGYRGWLRLAECATHAEWFDRGHHLAKQATA